LNIIKRSGFLKAARSQRWTTDKSKPTDLTEHSPETFDWYLHCVYSNKLPESIRPLVQTPSMDLVQGAKDAVYRADRQYESFIDLYILADALLDPVTANMMIHNIRRFFLRDGHLPGAGVVDRALQRTREGDGLRNLLADFYIYNGYTRFAGDFPNAFLLMVLRRIQHAKLAGEIVIDEEQLALTKGDNEWAMNQYYQRTPQLR
jgi:hypothetical protein